MKLRRPLALLSLAGAALAGAGAANAAEVSSNWAGYAVTSTDATTGAPVDFNAVSATWVQPKARCGSTDGASSAFWVGLGGNSEDSQALEQIGTAVDCDGGVANHYVWYEVVPAPSVPVKLKIFPGNRISASVRVTGSTITFRLDNLTRHTFFQKRVVADTLDLSSAEWVAEAPSSCTSFRCDVLPLANFGNVTFSKATAVANGHVGTITDPAWSQSEIWLVAEDEQQFFGPFHTATSTAGAVPNSLSADGSSFVVSWRTKVTPPPAAPTVEPVPSSTQPPAPSP